MANADQLVNAYVLLRDRKKELQDRHKDELAPYNTKMQIIEAELLRILELTGATNLKTGHGTAYMKDRSSIKIDDWNTTLKFVLENDLTHLLVRGLAKAGVEEYMAAQGEALPGVSINSEVVLNVRRT